MTRYSKADRLSQGENRRGTSILLDLAAGVEHTDTRPPGLNYSAIDASNVPPTDLPMMLMAGIAWRLLSEAEQVWAIADHPGRLSPPIYFSENGGEATAALMLSQPETFGHRASDRAMLVAVRCLMEAFRDRPRGIRWAIYGRSEIIVYEAMDLEAGHVAVDIYGSRALRDADPALEPGTFAEGVLRLLLGGCLFACIVTPGAPVPAERVNAKALFSGVSVGVHAAPEAVEAWTRFLREHCDPQALVEAHVGENQ